MNLKSDIMVQAVLGAADWIVFALIFFITVYAICYGNSLKKKGPGGLIDYLIMGRQLTFPMFVGTLVATWYGGIFGVTRIAFESGLFNFLTQGIFWYVAYIIFALFLVKKISPYKAITLPELAGKMFGPKSSAIAAVFTFLNVVPISYVISIGLFIQFITGCSLLAGMISGTLVVCLYSIYGGFRAVVFSDMVQFFVMCVSVFLVIAFSISSFGGADYLISNIPASHFSLTGNKGGLTTLVWSFIALSTLVDPNFYQRCFAAESPRVARNGILASTLIWCLFDLCTTFGALYARAAIPEADSDKAYLIYAVQILPSGLKGFFIGGILATILSTLDSYLFIAANTISYDFLRKKIKNVVVVNHISLFLVGTFAIVMGLYFKGDIKEVWKTLGSYSSACLLIPVLCGYIFPGFITDAMFVMSSLAGVAGITYWRFTGHSGVWANIDSFYVGLLMSVSGLVVMKGIIKLAGCRNTRLQ